MLKTQITGAKYLSPQTNQMTNLNIAVPADSKDTEFGTSDILLAKDVVAYLNALDSDVSKELDAQTDKINKINKSIKQLIDHNLIKIVTELPTTDIDKNCIYLVPNKDGEGNNVFIEYIYVESKNTFEEVGRIHTKVDLSDYYTKEETDNLILIAKNSAINIHNEDDTKSIKLDINDTEADEFLSCPVNMSLIYGDNKININPYDGIKYANDEGYNSYFGSYIRLSDNNDATNLEIKPDYISTEGAYCIILGDDNKFKISRPTNTEGGVISGIKSIAAFANPSATKVWATDGSTVDLTTKANTSDLDAKANASDVLLKKSASGGYYIESNNHDIGLAAFAANNVCTASGMFSFAEGYGKATINVSHAEGEYATASGYASHAEGSYTEASATSSHAEGYHTKASGSYSHAEGSDTKASGSYSHAEGSGTKASGAYSHAEGSGTNASDDYSHAEGSNTDARYGSHAEGSYTHAVGTYTHAEGEYTSASGAYSHAEGFVTHSKGESSHSEGKNTNASGYCSHALGIYNVDDKNAIHSVGIGNGTPGKNAEYIYAKNNEDGYGLTDDPKNGYKYLIGVGGYDGISTDNTTYKSVQEVIADLTARIEQLETKVRALEAANTPA